MANGVKDINKYWSDVENNPIVIISRLRGQMAEEAGRTA